MNKRVELTQRKLKIKYLHRISTKVGRQEEKQKDRETDSQKDKREEKKKEELE